MKPTLSLIALALAITLTGFASEIRFAWDASPSENVTNYVLYASTNTPLAVTNSAARLNVGTNLTGTVSELVAGRWSFAVTAQAAGLESDFSNIVIAEVPRPPANMRTVFLQYSGTLTNFYDVGFFKLRLLSPMPPIPTK